MASSTGTSLSPVWLLLCCAFAFSGVKQQQTELPGCIWSMDSVL